MIVVYDFDEDDTIPVVRELIQRHAGLELLKNELGRGVINAVRAGIAATTSEVVIVTMADLSDDVAIVPRMVELIRQEGYDVVCAFEVHGRGGAQPGGPWLKGFLSRTAGMSLYWLAGLPTHDATNAFRAHRGVLMERPSRARAVSSIRWKSRPKLMRPAGGSRRSHLPGATARPASRGSSLAARLPHYLRWYFYTLTHRPRPSP